MKKVFLTMVLAGILGVIHAQNNSNSLRESLSEPDNSEVSIIAHRGERGPRMQGESRPQGRNPRQAKPQSPELKAMIAETVGNFVQQVYQDEETGHSMKMTHFDQQKFFYVVAAGDPKASVGMAQLKKVLTDKGASFSEGEWSAKLPQAEQNAHVRELIAEGKRNNFITFTLKSVLAEDGSGHEHMSSFDYVYKLEAVRDWLFEQRKE